MRREVAPSIATAVGMLLLCIALAAASQEPRTFSRRITVVPVDVRVVDSRRRPVADLRREDFTVLENGVAQQISHFEIQKLRCL